MEVNQKITVESIQKELADLAEKDAKAIEAMKASYKKNVFKTRLEADKFLDTPEAKEKNMVLWIVREGGEMPCFMVNTPERIKMEQKRHAQFSTLSESLKHLTIMMEASIPVLGLGFSMMIRNRTKKFLELKLKYLKTLAECEEPSKKTISILEGLSSISYERAEISCNDRWIWLYGVRGGGIREDLDLFDIKITMILNRASRHKIHHCKYELFPCATYSFPWNRKTKGKGRIKFPWKTAFPGNKDKMMIRSLKKSIEYYPRPNEGVRILYAATNMPKLRKVIPEVEKFLGELYSELFKMEDYADWTPWRIRRMLSKVLKMKRTLDIPDEKPLAIGADETSMVINELINALRKWIVTETWKIPGLTKEKHESLLKGKAVNIVNPPNGYHVRILPGATHYKLKKSKI